MSSDTHVRTRTPNDVGYLPWVLSRASAVVLVFLLIIHLGVQLYPQYGFSVIYSWGIYGALLDLTLALLLLHGILGMRATILGTSASERVKSTAVWAVSIVALGLFVYRLFG